jgi:hypothetical protein
LRYQIIPAEIPLPISNSGSDYLDSHARDTPIEVDPSTLATKDDKGPPNTAQQNMEQQNMSASAEPRGTAAANEASTAYLADLAGVGSAHDVSHFEIHTANLDDDLTTDMHNEELAVESSGTG